MANVLLYNLAGKDKMAAIRVALMKLGISARTVLPEEYGLTVGYIAGLEGFGPTPEENAGEFSDEMLVMNGLKDAQIDLLLEMLRRSRIAVALKAVVTPDNAGWSSSKLHSELLSEHEAMKKLRAKDAAKHSAHRK